MPPPVTGLGPDTVGDYLRQAAAGACREFPNAPGFLLTGPQDLRRPREVHPAFYGCLDWHSAVHTHWTMARLCRLLPDAPGVGEARSVLAEHLTGPTLAAEAAYLADPAHGWFERPYGRAWALMLAAELRHWADESGDPDVLGWVEAAEPLRDTVRAGFIEWLPRLGHPVRTGTHANTAFALLLILDAAPWLGAPAEELAGLVRRVAVDWFGTDVDYPARLEPSGSDFLSPSLVEAALMRRVLEPEEFATWFTHFLPGLPAGRPAGLFAPVWVSDRADPHGVHLDGLNLSRAWCWRDLAIALPASDPRRGAAEDAARAHLDAALPYVRTGDFMAEHWLATFAVLATT